MQWESKKQKQKQRKANYMQGGGDDEDILHGLGTDELWIWQRGGWQAKYFIRIRSSSEPVLFVYQHITRCGAQVSIMDRIGT